MLLFALVGLVLSVAVVPSAAGSVEDDQGCYRSETGSCSSGANLVIANQCGSLDDGSSPYLNNMNCSWTIAPTPTHSSSTLEVASSKFVRVFFRRLETEVGCPSSSSSSPSPASSVCRDGVRLSAAGNEVATLCGVGNVMNGEKLHCIAPSSSTSTSSSSSLCQEDDRALYLFHPAGVLLPSPLSVHFFSDNSGNMEGWSLDWQSEEVVSSSQSRWSSFSPQVLVRQGGLTLTVQGQGFEGPHRCSFTIFSPPTSSGGEVEQTIAYVDARVLSPSRLTCVSPPLSSQARQVALQVWRGEGGGNSSTNGLVLVPPPTTAVSEEGTRKASDDPQRLRAAAIATSSGSNNNNNNNNNNIFFLPQILTISEQGLPDLVLDASEISLHLPASELSPSQLLLLPGVTPGQGAIQAVVWNNGTADALNFVVQFQLVLNTTDSTHSIIPFVRGTVAVCKLAAGQSMVVSLPEGARIPTWVGDALAPRSPPTFANIRVVADVTNAVVELDEENNAAVTSSSSSSVQVLDSESVQQNQQYRVVDVAVDRVDSLDDYLGAPGMPIHDNRNVRAIVRNFGNTRAENVAVVFEVASVADSSSAPSSSSSATTPATATPAPAASSSSASASPSSAFRRFLRGSVVLCSISPGGSVIVTLPAGARLPSVMEEGRAVVRAVVDPLGLTEGAGGENGSPSSSSPTYANPQRLRRNNVADSTSFSSSRIVPAKPDLVVDGVFWDRTSAAALRPGSPLPGLRAVIRNRGFAPATNFAVAFKTAAESSSAAAFAPIVRGSSVVCSLQAGQTMVVPAGQGARVSSSVATTPASLLRAFVDPLQQLEEISETNNFGDLLFGSSLSSTGGMGIHGAGPGTLDSLTSAGVNNNNNNAGRTSSGFHRAIGVGLSGSTSSLFSPISARDEEKALSPSFSSSPTASATGEQQQQQGASPASATGSSSSSTEEEQETNPDSSPSASQIGGGTAVVAAMLIVGAGFFFTRRRKMMTREDPRDELVATVAAIANAEGAPTAPPSSSPSATSFFFFGRRSKRKGSPPPPLDRSLPLNSDLTPPAVVSPGSVEAGGVGVGNETCSSTVSSSSASLVFYPTPASPGGNHGLPPPSAPSISSFDPDYVIVMEGDKVAVTSRPPLPNAGGIPTAQAVANRLMTKRSRRPKELGGGSGGGGGADEVGHSGFHISPRMPFTPVASLISPSVPEPLTPMNPGGVPASSSAAAAAAKTLIISPTTRKIKD